MIRILAIFGFFALALITSYSIAPAPPLVLTLPALETVVEAPRVEQNKLRIPRNGTLARTLKKLGLTSRDVHEILESARPHYNLNRIPRDVVIHYGENPLAEFSIQLGPMLRLRAQRAEDSWSISKDEISVKTEVVNFQGVVEWSLWSSAKSSQMDPQLIVQLAEIFGWQVDFSREVRKGDTWRISVEKNTTETGFQSWGRIIAAEYVNRDRNYSAFAIEEEGVFLGYFDRKGNSLEKMFLKSPLKFGRISSRFSRRRFHPIKKVYRPHLGVDYAAPRGTPIRAVGDGRVLIRKYGRSTGRMIKLRHNAKYQSAYMHLDSFKKGLRVGTEVKQGDVIGYVGKSGLATGYHLHYEFYVNKRYVDPLAIEFPSADPIPQRLRSQFLSQVQKLNETLPQWAETVAQK